MSDYDILYGVVLRLPGGNGGDIVNNIDEISERLGKAIQTEFEDFMAIPFGMELVEDDKKVRILNQVEYPKDYPETDDDVSEYDDW